MRWHPAVIEHFSTCLIPTSQQISHKSIMFGTCLNIVPLWYSKLDGINLLRFHLKQNNFQKWSKKWKARWWKLCFSLDWILVGSSRNWQRILWKLFQLNKSDRFKGTVQFKPHSIYIYFPSISQQTYQNHLGCQCPFDQ